MGYFDKHLALAFGERLQLRIGVAGRLGRGRAGDMEVGFEHLLDQTLGRRRRDDRIALVDRADRTQQRLRLGVFEQAAEDKLEEQLATVAQADDAMPYAATESVGEYLADDMGLKDVTPKGYKQAAANESEPTPSDIKQFTDLLKKGDAKMLIINSQEPSDMTDQLISAADSGNVPVVDMTEQMPSNYKGLHEWITEIIDQMQATQKK